MVLSNYNKFTKIENNHFYMIGGSAIALVGDPKFTSKEPWNLRNSIDFPDKITIQNNFIVEIGMSFKQSSGVFLAISRNVFIYRNIIFNGPRAGITFNDGFGGNNTVIENVVFNQVRDTNDHGPFNAWDRQRWLQPDVDPLPNRINDNLFIGNVEGPKGIDLDDGTNNYINENNVVIYGCHKFKGYNIFARNNLVLFAYDIGCTMLTPASRSPSNMVSVNNTCVTRQAPYGYYGDGKELALLCSLKNFRAARNAIFVPPNMDVRFKGCKGEISWEQWLQSGQDVGSRITRQIPTTEVLLSWIDRKLPWLYNLSVKNSTL